MAGCSPKSLPDRGHILANRFMAGLSRRLLAAMLPVFTAALLCAPAARANVTYSGDISPTTDPATWTGGASGTTAYIGYTTGDGTLTLDNGSALSSYTGYLGYAAGTQGSVTVDGTGTQWTHGTGNLTLGNYGTGTLIIKNGGTVSVAGTPLNPAFTYLGYTTGSMGSVTVDGAGSQLIGFLTIGSYNSNSGTGSITITNGGTVSGGIDSYNSGSVTVDGANSHLVGTGTNTVSSGTLTISNGGYVGNTRGTVGRLTTNTGTAIVDGAGSKWVNSDLLSVSSSGGTGVLYITNGGYVSNTRGIICSGAVKGTVTVAGAGSRWDSSDLLTIGFLRADTGILTIGNGGGVIAPNVTIGTAASVLTADVRATLNVGNGTGTITNNGGIIRMVAGAGVANGAYTPVSAGTWTTTGAIQVLGGVYDATTHGVTVVSAATTSAGTATTLDLSQTQRVLVSDAATGQSLGAAFQAATSATNLTFSATAMGASDLASLQHVISKPVFGGWDFATAGSPVYLSLPVGAGRSLTDLTVWKYDRATSAWSKYAADDLAYDGTSAGFTVTDPGSYAVSGGVTTPGAPTGLTVVPGNGQATVTFSPATSDGGSAITGYTVTTSPEGGVDSASGSLSLNRTITGLTNNTYYTLTVTAINAAGAGIPLKSATVVPFTTPGAPSGVTAVAGDGKATVTFTELATQDTGGSQITGYTVASNPAGGVDSNAGSTGTTHVITGLTNGTAYTFTVTATNAAGSGPASAPSNSVIPVAAAPIVLIPVIGAPSTAIARSGATVTYIVSYNGADRITLANNDVTLTRTGTASGSLAVGGSGTASRTVSISSITGDGTLGIAIAPGTATAGNGAITAQPSAASATFAVDTTGPALTVATLADGTITSNTTLTITGTASDAGTIQSLTVNGRAIIPDPAGAFGTTLLLASGANSITVTATDTAGNQTTDSRTIILDVSAPAITFNDPTPADGSLTGQQTITITGTISEPGTVAVRVGTGAFQAATMGDNSTAFTCQATLTPGRNTLDIRATDLVNDGSSNTATVQRTITYRPLTLADPLRALQIAVGLVIRTAADDVLDVGPLVNGKPHADGVIDISDATALLSRVVGLASW